MVPRPSITSQFPYSTGSEPRAWTLPPRAATTRSAAGGEHVLPLVDSAAGPGRAEALHRPAVAVPPPDRELAVVEAERPGAVGGDGRVGRSVKRYRPRGAARRVREHPVPAQPVGSVGELVAHRPAPDDPAVVDEHHLDVGGAPGRGTGSVSGTLRLAVEERLRGPDAGVEEAEARRAPAAGGRGRSAATAAPGAGGPRVDQPRPSGASVLGDRPPRPGARAAALGAAVHEPRAAPGTGPRPTRSSRRPVIATVAPTAALCRPAHRSRQATAVARGGRGAEAASPSASDRQDEQSDAEAGERRAWARGQGSAG